MDFSVISDEEITSFYDEVTRRFGEHMRWTVLILMPQIDMKTGKFPDYMRNGMFNEMLDFIENSEIIRKLVAKKSGDAQIN